MADGTAIEWTDATWNPVTGCSVVSPGCTNCYAMKLAGTRLKHVASRAGLTKMTKAGPVWTGETRFNANELLKPLRWRRPRKIFVCAHGDLFHESVPDEWIDRVFAVMALCPQHQFQVLTKRSARMRRYFGQCERDVDPIIQEMDQISFRLCGDDRMLPDGPWWPLSNVWLGVSVEDQARADERIPDLLATPAALRFLSCEPLLGALDLRSIKHPARDGRIIDALTGHHWSPPLHVQGDDSGSAIRVPAQDNDYWSVAEGCAKIGWAIVGGENGPRPMKLEWARSLRDQCAAAGTPFFFKQWGSYLPPGQMMADGSIWPADANPLHAAKSLSGHFLDGQVHQAFPHGR
jgi:protein gp37